LTWLHVGNGLPVHNGGRAKAERCWGVGVEMAERGKPLALRALFIAARRRGRRRRKLRAERWRRRSRGRGNVAMTVVRMPAARLGASVKTGSPTGGSRMVLVFSQFVLKPAQLVRSKWRPYHALKIPNFCMMVVWTIVNNILDCEDFKFQTETKLKIPEQIQYLNI
jgi:hypothetical protein